MGDERRGQIRRRQVDDWGKPMERVRTSETVERARRVKDTRGLEKGTDRASQIRSRGG